MGRSDRKTMIRAALELTYGLQPTFVPTDAVLAINPSHRVMRTLVDREIWYPHYGASEQLVGTIVAEIKFTVELAGSGTAGTPPPWAPLMRACGMAMIATVGNRVEFNPVTDDQSSVTLQYAIDGVRYVSRGARGTAGIKLMSGAIPQIEFTFTGLESLAFESGAFAGQYDLSAWKRPEVLTDANAGDIRLGGSYNLGFVSGGTVLASRGLELNLGNTVEHDDLLGGQGISITDRKVTGKMSTALTPAQEVAWRNDINAGLNTTLGFNWGSTAGNRGTIFAPKVQRVDPQHENYRGSLLMATDLRVQPNVGHDDFLLVMR